MYFSSLHREVAMLGDYMRFYLRDLRRYISLTLSLDISHEISYILSEKVKKYIDYMKFYFSLSFFQIESFQTLFVLSL